MGIVIQNEKQFKHAVNYGLEGHKKCTNCSMYFSDECNKDTEEWVRAVSKGICGKCYEEIVDHESGDSSV